MKVLSLVPTYPRFQNDVWFPAQHALCKELAKVHDVEVICSAGPETKNEDSFDNVRIHRFKYFFDKQQKLTYTGGMLPMLKKDLTSWIQLPFFMLSFTYKSFKYARKADVIHCYFTLAGIPGVIIKKLLNKPLVVTPLGTDIRSIPRIINKFVFKNADAITISTPEFTWLLENKYGIKNNVYDIKHCLDYDKFFNKVSEEKKENLRKEFNIKKDKVVTFLARMIPVRDPITFVKAIPFVLKEDKNIKFLIVGSGVLLDEVKKEVNKLNLGDRAVVTGQRNDTDTIFEVTDLYVMTSTIENCINVSILEAMSKKVPCILTDVGFTNKVFLHKHDAYLVKSEDPELLAKTILKVFADKELMKALSENGPKFIQREGFERETISVKMTNLYQKIRKNGN